MSKESLNLNFECLVRQFLGNGTKTAHLTGVLNIDSIFNKELRGCLIVMRKKIDELDTTTNHKEDLMNDVELMADLLKIHRNTDNEVDKEIILRLFWLISHLFGIREIERCHTYPQPFYCQTVGQYLREQERLTKKDFLTLEKAHKRNVITLRKQVCTFLKEKGEPDTVIADVLNMSEYKLKKLKHNV